MEGYCSPRAVWAERQNCIAVVRWTEAAVGWWAAVTGVEGCPAGETVRTRCLERVLGRCSITGSYPRQVEVIVPAHSTLYTLEPCNRGVSNEKSNLPVIQ